MVDSFFYRDLDGPVHGRFDAFPLIGPLPPENIRNNNLFGREFPTSYQVAKMGIMLTSVANVVTVTGRRTDNAIAQRESSIKVYQQDSKLLESVVN